MIIMDRGGGCGRGRGGEAAAQAQVARFLSLSRRMPHEEEGRSDREREGLGMEKRGERSENQTKKRRLGQYFLGDVDDTWRYLIP